MALTPGMRLGPYEIVAPLGAGGMGEVWRARDPRLGRDVAIKALPDIFAKDPERLARFEREARLLASLNHPNIGAIHGLEVVDGSQYLVLEFVAGETLADAIARGALPVADAIEVCGQIAAALETAHESGVVHRDLKPANVMWTKTGTVKVLDFGLARTGVVDPSDPDPASPTMKHEPTRAGVVFGTAAYMSPEQARGKAVDKRTDIWSFGCVLYECLTGRHAFAGESISDVIAHILTREPDLEALPEATPPRVRELLRRCLEKDARWRLRDLGDARIELNEARSWRPSSGPLPAASTPRKRLRLRDLVAVSLGALATFAVLRVLAPMVQAKAPPRRPVRFELPNREGMGIFANGGHLALSPDETTLAFVAGDSAGNRLWVRPLESLVSRPLAGTEGADMPFWSPDGKHLAFFTDTRLRRIALATGEVTDVATVKRARGGSWNSRDEILYAPLSEGPLYVVSADGGQPRQVTTLDSARGESAQRFPEFLPDGRHYLYTSMPPHDDRFTIRIGSLAGGAPESLTVVQSGVHYAAPGYLLFQENHVLMAQQFDARRRRTRGRPFTLREGVAQVILSGAPGFAASGTRALAYSWSPPARTALAWMDFAGKEIGRPPLATGQYTGVAIAPGGTLVALTRDAGTDPAQIWIGDLRRGTITRFSEESVVVEAPAWSPDGLRIAYLAGGQTPQTVVVRDLWTSTTRTFLTNEPVFKAVAGWTPDGASLVLNLQRPNSRWDIEVLDLATGKLRPYLSAPADEQAGQVSPDGRWLAYYSNETGRDEIYVSSFPQAGPRYQVTTAGGLRPGWLAGGRQLSYGLESDPLAQRVADVVPGPEFDLRQERVLIRLDRPVISPQLAPDGRLLVLVLDGGEQNSTTVVLDWLAGIRK
jgi:eukaryotic-like serine/threonine-protein kinase